MKTKLYTDLAKWWRLMSPVEDYAEEATLFKAVFLEHSTDRPRSLLELGSGGGHNAFHLKQHFSMTLVDLSEEMLQQSREINPELAHHRGDMRSVRLGEVFDVVFIHDAVSYMATRADLRRAMETAHVHCRPGGMALFTPDETAERFVPQTSNGGTDAGERGFRYLEWCHDPDPDDETITTDFAFLIREDADRVRVEHERHVHGLFPRQVWLDTMQEVGFEPHAKVYEHSELPDGFELFIGQKKR